MNISIVVPITRKWAIPNVVSNLQGLDYGNVLSTTLLYVDSNDADLYSQAVNQTYPHPTYALLSKNQQTMERKVAYRRNRIVDMKYKTAQLIDPCDYVFSFEDDTVVPPDALMRLLNIMAPKKFCGFAQGIQCGRWDLPMLGAWKVDDVIEPTRINTLPLLEGVHKVDAGGFFCYLTTYDLYTTIPYSWHDECFGPDVSFGLEVRKKALSCYTDFGLVCGHMQQNGKTLYPTGDEKELAWYLKDGHWIRDFSYYSLQKEAKNDAK